MQIIHEQVDLVKQVLRKQKPTGKPLRKMHYVVRQEVEGKVLLYNSITRELLLLTPDEEAGMLASAELYEKWFVVPDDFNEREFTDQLRGLARMVKRRTEGIDNYTIFTTMDCNARCFYCYETGRPRVPMSEYVAHRTAQFIVAHHRNEVKLGWFGGEPLYNMPVIDTIVSDLQQAGVPYHSTMISNAYLFTPELVERARTVWKLKDIQITLDGTEKVYNRAKSYIYPGNAFARVLDNISLLLGAEVKVVVRLNADLYNIDDLNALVDQLYDRFGNHPLLSVYSHALFERSAGSHNMKRNDEKRHEIFRRRMKLNGKLFRYGFFMTGARIPNSIRTNSCMADNDSTVTVLPTGRLGKCEHYSEDHFIGTLASDKFDQKMLDYFKQLAPLSPNCDTCAYYPECLRLKTCVEEDGNCFDVQRKECIMEMRQEMLNEYAAWLEERGLLPKKADAGGAGHPLSPVGGKAEKAEKAAGA